MTEFNWEAFGAFAELLGALAVVASLFYVGSQVREGSRATRGQTYESISNSLNASANILISEPGLVELMVSGIRNQPLSENERLRYTVYVLTLLRTVESAHYQYTLGLLSDAKLASLIDVTRLHLASDVGQTLWASRKDMHEPDFREFVEGLIDSAESNAGLQAVWNIDPAAKSEQVDT